MSKPASRFARTGQDLAALAAAQNLASAIEARTSAAQEPASLQPRFSALPTASCPVGGCVVRELAALDDDADANRQWSPLATGQPVEVLGSAVGTIRFDGVPFGPQRWAHVRFTGVDGAVHEGWIDPEYVLPVFPQTSTGATVEEEKAARRKRLADLLERMKTNPLTVDLAEVRQLAREFGNEGSPLAAEVESLETSLLMTRYNDLMQRANTDISAIDVAEVRRLARDIAGQQQSSAAARRVFRELARSLVQFAAYIEMEQAAATMPSDPGSAQPPGMPGVPAWCIPGTPGVPPAIDARINELRMDQNASADILDAFASELEACPHLGLDFFVRDFRARAEAMRARGTPTLPAVARVRSTASRVTPYRAWQGSYRRGWRR